MKASSIILLCVIGVNVSSCTEFASRVRRYTYPPDFRYVSREQLQSGMWQLAYHWREVNRLMRLSEDPRAHRAEIADHLLAMEAAASRLDQSGWSSNHPLVDINLAHFRRDLKIAREAIERDPPNFLLAAPITGACVYCHGRP